MEIQRIDEYTKNGCDFKGNLAMVNYWQAAMEESRTKPLNGFGSMNCFEYSARAGQVMTEAHPEHEVLLTTPDYVVRLQEGA